MKSADSTATAPSATPQRMLAVDTFCGFDMFWMIGGRCEGNAPLESSFGEIVNRLIVA